MVSSIEKALGPDRWTEIGRPRGRSRESFHGSAPGGQADIRGQPAHLGHRRQG